MTDIIAEATIFAAQAHAGQVDRRDESYIYHPIAVAAPFRYHPRRKILYPAALLHDVVEDCGAMLDEIEEKFGKEIRDIVDAVSRRDSETYTQFIERVALHPDGTLVKLSDIADNVSPERETPDGAEFLVRYHKARLVLQEAQDQRNGTLVGG